MWKGIVGGVALAATFLAMVAILTVQGWFMLLLLRVFAWSAHLPWPPGGTLV